MNKGTHIAFVCFCVVFVVTILVLLMMWDRSMFAVLPAVSAFV